MSQIVQNLEREYDIFINKEQPLPFFKGLAGYLKHALSVPALKKIFDEQMAERRILINQIEEAEKKTRGEMSRVKTKLLAIIKKDKIDVGSFKRNATTSFPGDNTTILQELEYYEKGSYAGNRFVSEEIQRHLVDITENLLRLGYKEELKEFVVSYEPRRIFDFSNVVFSKTLPERIALVNRFEKERGLEAWGDFETLMQFYAAYKLALSGRANDLDQLFGSVLKGGLVLEVGLEPDSWFGNSKEQNNIITMAHEVHSLVESGQDFWKTVHFPREQRMEVKRLKQQIFKDAAQKVHNHLIRVAFETKNVAGQDFQEDTYATGSGYKRPHLLGDSFVCGDKRMPMQRGQRKMMELLLSDARVFRGTKRTKRGSEINRSVLQKEGGYRDETSWRNALNKMKRKTKNCTSPEITIQSVTTNNYIMEILYQKIMTMDSSK